MLTLPLALLLYLYYAVVAIAVIFQLIMIYHLLLSAATTFTSLTVTFFVLAATVLTVYGTWYLLREVNWETTLTVFESAWFRSSPSYSF